MKVNKKRTLEFTAIYGKKVVPLLQFQKP